MQSTVSGTSTISYPVPRKTTSESPATPDETHNLEMAALSLQLDELSHDALRQIQQMINRVRASVTNLVIAEQSVDAYCETEAIASFIPQSALDPKLSNDFTPEIPLDLPIVIPAPPNKDILGDFPRDPVFSDLISHCYRPSACFYESGLLANIEDIELAFDGLPETPAQACIE